MRKWGAGREEGVAREVCYDKQPRLGLVGIPPEPTMKRPLSTGPPKGHPDSSAASPRFFRVPVTSPGAETST